MILDNNCLNFDIFIDNFAISLRIAIVKVIIKKENQDSKLKFI